MFLGCYFKLVVAIVRTLVSIYVAVVKVRLDKKVNHIVNIPTIPKGHVNDQQNTSRIQRIDEEPKRINEADKDCDIPNLGASSSKSNQAEIQTNEEMDEKISPIVNAPTMWEKDQVDTQNARRIKRMNEDRNMFYQVDIIHEKPFSRVSH